MRAAPMFAAVLLLFASRNLAADESKPTDDLTQLKGVWRVVSTSGHGTTITAEGQTGHDGQPLWGETSFTFAGDQLKTTQEPVVLPKINPAAGFIFAIRYEPASYRVKITSPEEGPAQIDLTTPEGMVLKGIYELKGDSLKLALVNWLACDGANDAAKAAAADAKERPAKFTPPADGQYVFYVLQRANP